MRSQGQGWVLTITDQNRYLSSDGKHAAHVGGETPEEMVRLLPKANNNEAVAP